MNIKILIGKRFREIRQKHNYTQAKLAEMLGIDDKHLSRIELGKNMPNSALIEKFMTLFDLDIRELFECSHLDTPENTKKRLIQSLENMDPEQLSLTYKYVRTFVL